MPPSGIDAGLTQLPDALVSDFASGYSVRRELEGSFLVESVKSCEWSNDAMEEGGPDPLDLARSVRVGQRPNPRARREQPSEVT
jgi:hypothetical protein